MSSEEDSPAQIRKEIRGFFAACALVEVLAEVAMRAFLGSVLSVIAAGVLLIAYGLLSPRAAAAPFGPAPVDGSTFQSARPMLASDIVTLGQPGSYDGYRTTRPIAYAVNDVRPVSAVRTSGVRERATSTRVARTSGRDWKKTALIVGGTTAAGAGLGAIFGGGKGALIGAAIGGGASTIYEATKR